MPFSETTKRHTQKYWDDFFYKFVKPAVEKFGYSCNRSKAYPSNIIKDILNELLEADLVLAILTDFNANVWYELGIRHALKKGTIMMIEDGQNPPFDISHYGVIKYIDTILGGNAFENELQKFIKKIESDHPIDSPAIEFLGPQVREDYRQRIEDLEMNYRRKIDKIYLLLRDFQKNTAKTEKSEKKKMAIVRVKTKPKKKRRVLWVDDVPINNEAVVDLFRGQGVEFDLAINTEQALDFLAKEEYDLILSDIGRGEQADAGIRMIRDIRRHFGTYPPILIYSSLTAISNYGESATKIGASFVTASPRELVLRMTDMLGL